MTPIEILLIIINILMIWLAIILMKNDDKDGGIILMFSVALFIGLCFHFYEKFNSFFTTNLW